MSQTMTSAMRRFAGLLLGAGALMACAAQAEEGVTPDAIAITRVISLEGPAGAKGREQEVALRAYFASVNQGGGIHGRKVVLKTVDEDLRTEVSLKRIHEAHRPFAFFLFGGTAGSTIAMHYAEQHKIPFVAPNSGATVFHQPPHRHVFNVRARYRDEVISALRHFSVVNHRRVALIRVDDAFGQDAASGFEEGVALTGITAAYRGILRDNTDNALHLRHLVEDGVQAVICVGPSRRVAEFIVAARQAKVGAVFMTLSNNASSGFARDLGSHARGVIVSQVTPPAATQSTRLSRELRQLLADAPEAQVSYAAMEAYASAKVLVEGLRKAGPHLTREGYVQALESLRRFDLGGLEVDFTPPRRSGSSHVELSILAADGRYLR